ncbi:sterol desaturase [Oleiphilus messinensis]|uniref:Sterol desaturase n=1 Tax=Oleiphilus messinensis TaxID=141451 RepID=A0A1Y0I2C8_9GAMM|nr:sterol desaturase family protein [Oleiphilus messinensis]ARU54627.1 sterol desaturase [Oleiphilus messinensis]
MDIFPLPFFEWVFDDVVRLVAAGIVFQLLSHWFPFREQESPREVIWDIVAMLFASICVVLYGEIVGAWLVSTLTVVPVLEVWYEIIAPLPLFGLLLGTLLLGDFFAYWTHRLMHTTKLGWQQHAWHHTPKHIWWLSGLRGTPLHLVLTMGPYTLGNIFFLPPDIAENSWILTTVFIIGLINQHGIHSNIRVPYPAIVEKILVTPRFHFVHHSADIRFTNSNYGFIFSFWDKLFGSYTNPECVAKDEQLGLDYRANYVKLMLGLPHSHLPPLEGENLASTPATK